MEKRYYNEIDVFKGGAILLIILLHSRCQFPLDVFHADEMRFVNGFISFMTPNALFFFSSGFLFHKTADKKLFLKKKALRLLLPMLFFGIISVTLRLLASNYTRSHLDNALSAYCSILLGHYYWFLYALFLMFCIKNFLNQKIESLICILFLAYSLFGLVEKQDLNIIQKCSFYYIWFTSGCIIGNSSIYIKYKESVNNNKKVYLVATLIALLICIYLYTDVVKNVYILYFTPILSICIALVISISLQNNKLLSFFGKYSLQYYLNHILILLACFYIGSLFFSYIPHYFITYCIIVLCTILFSSIMLYVEIKLKRVHFFLGLPQDK